MDCTNYAQLLDNLGPAQIGLTNLPLLVVGLIGSPLSGWMADAVAKFMAKRNNGIFEPEFRLTLMLIATPLATAGFLGFGMSVQNGAPLVWPIVFMSIHSLSVPFASQASLTYVIDCHPKDANQAFVTINFTKAVFTFLATTYANGWFASAGPRAVFDAITLINLGICALTIPAYVFGKRFRGMVSHQVQVMEVQCADSMSSPRSLGAASAKIYPSKWHNHNIQTTENAIFNEKVQTLPVRVSGRFRDLSIQFMHSPVVIFNVSIAASYSTMNIYRERDT